MAGGRGPAILPGRRREPGFPVGQATAGTSGDRAHYTRSQSLPALGAWSLPTRVGSGRRADRIHKGDARRMSILRDFEKRLEGAVEGFFARAFKSGLQPVELAKAVQRYPSSYQQVGIDSVVVPNVYRFTLSPDDLERFGGYVNALQRELADVVVRTADEEGWTLKGPVRIEFEEGDHVRVGTYELRGKIEAKQAPARAPEPSEAAPARGGSTRVLEAQPESAAAVLHVIGGSAPPKRVTGDATIGRLPECDLTLSDPSVSRRHAKVSRQDGAWTITDLGSTNGVKVNGEHVDSARLEDGDRIELGSIRLAFSTEG
jgi:hypothetical protein